MMSRSASTIPGLCAEYIRLADEALERRPFALPDINDLAAIQLPNSGIKSARHTGGDQFRLGWPFVAIQMDDSRGERTERYVDQSYFVAMQLFAYAGCHLGLMPSKTVKGEPPRWYLAYGKKEHQLRRIIANTGPGSDTRQKHPTANPATDGRSDAHYDYRRVTLTWKPKSEVRAAGHETRSKSRGREEAIIFAVEQFKQKPEDSRLAEIRKRDAINPSVFEALLREALRVADRMHDAFLEARPGVSRNGSLR
jgi:hypothetical protein